MQSSVINKGKQRRRRVYLPKLPVSQQRAEQIYRFLFVVTPLVSFALVEMLNYNNIFTSFTPVQICLNLAWYYLLEFVLYFIRGRTGSALKWSLGISWGLGMTNHYLIAFRGRTLFPGDFLSLRTAANVVGDYSFRLDSKQIIATIIMAAYVVAVCLLPPQWERRKWSWKRFAPAAVAACAFFILFFQTGFLDVMQIEPSMWTTRGNGLALNFSLCLKKSSMEAPEGYSAQVVERLNAQEAEAAQTAAAAETRPVNVIVIMNEALSDLSVLPMVETNQDAMPFMRSMTENTIKGYAYASVFGGTTANSEYEFLSGNSTAFVPAGTVPYQMYVSQDDPTLVSQLKSEGYRAVAMHAYRSSGWNRVSVYNSFGFDEQMYQQDYTDKAYIRDYISDQSNYENLIRVYEEKEAGEKLFIFNVTMQNHSAYSGDWDGLEKSVWLTGALENRFSTVNQYLSLVYESDKAMEYLVDYFSNVDEPTVLLCFGDHQPQVATNFYTTVLGEDPDVATAERKQMVPFFLWANYDIPEAEGVETSINYLSTLLADTAGLDLTGYQKLLKETQQTLPVINTVGMRDAQGNWYETAEELPEDAAAALQTYQIASYNYIFDKRNRIDAFFR